MVEWGGWADCEVCRGNIRFADLRRSPRGPEEGVRCSDRDLIAVTCSNQTDGRGIKGGIGRILLKTDDVVPNNRRRIVCSNSRDNAGLHLLLCNYILTIPNLY